MSEKPPEAAAPPLPPDRVAEIKRLLTGHRLVAVVVVAATVLTAVLGLWKTVLEGWRSVFPQVALIARPQRPVITGIVNESVAIELDLTLDSTTAVVASDVKLVASVSREAAAASAPPGYRPAEEECDIEKADLVGPSIDSKNGKATHAIHLTCHRPGRFKLLLRERSEALRQEATASVDLEMVPWYMDCLRKQSDGAKSPMRSLSPGGFVNTFMETVREVSDFKLLIPQEAERTDPVRATLWISRGFAGQAAGPVYSVYSPGFAFHGAERGDRCRGLWPDLKGPDDRRFEEVAFVGPELNPTIVPVGYGVYAMRIDNVGRLTIKDVKDEVCSPLKVESLGKPPPQGSPQTFEWLIPDKGVRVQAEAERSADGRTMDNHMSVGKRQAREYRALDEPTENSFPLIVPLSEDHLAYSKSFLMLDGMPALTALECRRR